MAPLFDKYHVDLVLSGHNHNYERTNPITFVETDKAKPKIENDRLNDYIDTFGTVYAVPGSGGRSLYDQTSKQYYVLKQFQGHGFLKLFMEQNGTKLRAEFLAIDGNVKDNFSLTKEGLVPPPPPPEPCPAGQHRDPTTGQCVDDTPPPPPPPPSGDNDVFGVKKIYPDGPGSNWTMPKDPRNDPRANNPEASGSKPNWASAPNPDGSWRMNGPATVRWAITQDNGFKQSEMSCCTDICEPRGYMQDPKDWKNIEQTVYWRLVKAGTGTGNGGVHIENVMRGQRSTTSNTGNGPGGCALGCSDNLHANAYPATGRVKFEKDLFHTSGYSQDIEGVQKLNATRKWNNNTWIGFKSIVYNKPDGSVQLEMWCDENANNTWKKVHEFNDHGQWVAKSTADLSKCHSKNGQVITWGGPLTAFRNDNMAQIDIKWASIRSITPPGDTPPPPPEPCPEHQHRDPVTGLCVPDDVPPPEPSDWVERKIASATASGNDGNLPSNAIDGKLDTRWSSLGKGQNITLQLETAASVGQVRIAWYKGDTRKNTFVVSTSTDGTTFKQVLSTVSAGNTADYESYTFPAETEEPDVKAIKVTVNGNTVNDWASITEIKAFGKGNVMPPPTDQWVERKTSSMLNQETITLTLEQPSKVGMARVQWFEPNTRQYTYSILVSPDRGITWEEVVNGISAGQNQDISFPNGEEQGVTQARIVVTNTVTGTPGNTSAFSVISFKVFGKASDVPPPPPPPPPPAEDPVAVIKPDAPTAMPGESLSLDASQSKNATTYAWSVTQVGNGSVSITSSSNTPNVNVKIGSDATPGGKSTMKLVVANAVGKQATAQKDIVVGQTPPPPPPAGDILWDSDTDGKWSNGHARTLTKAHEFDPDCKTLELAAGATRKLEIDGKGTAKITGDRARIYIHANNYNAQLDVTFTMNKSLDDCSTKLRSRHNEGDPTDNRFGGYGSAVGHTEVDNKREDYHNVHTSLGKTSLSRKLEDGKTYTMRFILRDTADGKPQNTTYLDYGDGKFVKVADVTDKSPKGYQVDKALYAKKSYIWVRCNGTSGTPFMEVRHVTLRKL